MKETNTLKKREGGGVCIAPHQRNSHWGNQSFLPCSRGPATVNTQRGIGGHREAGSYRARLTGSILSATVVSDDQSRVTYRLYLTCIVC